MFWSARKHFKDDSIDYIIKNLWFRVTYIILHNLPNKNLQALLESLILCNFQIRACLNQHKNSKKLIQITMQLVISDLGWLILFCVICRTQIHRSFLQRHLMATLSLINKKKEERKRKKKNSKHFSKHLLGILVGFP